MGHWLLSLGIALLISFAFFMVGYLNGKMDRWSWKTHLSSDYWWGNNSWKNKWALDFQGNPIKINAQHWYYFGWYKTDYVEKFPFSSSILVFTTDGWHLSKFLMFTILELIIACLLSAVWWKILILVIVAKILRGLGFSYVYDKA